MSNDRTKVTLEHIESDQSYDERLSKEDIEAMIAEITADTVTPAGSLHVPQPWKKPGMHYYFMKVDIARHDELSNRYKMKPSRNAKGECHYLEDGHLILMESPIEVHNHIKKLREQNKAEKAKDLLIPGAAVQGSQGVFVTKDSKQSRDDF